MLNNIGKILALLVHFFLHLYCADAQEIFPRYFTSKNLDIDKFDFKCSKTIYLPSRDTVTGNDLHFIYNTENTLATGCEFCLFPSCIVEIVPKPDENGEVNGTFFYINNSYILGKETHRNRDTIILVQGFLKNGKPHGLLYEHVYMDICSNYKTPCWTYLFMYENGVKKDFCIRLLPNREENGLYDSFHYFEVKKIQVKE